MKTVLKIFLTFIFLLNFSCTRVGVISDEEARLIVNKAQDSKILVIDIYHNHCPPCRFIDPIFEKLKEQYKEKSSVAFLKYDLSNPFTMYSSLKIAKGLGLESLYKAQRYTGVVLFVDTKNKNVLSTLVAQQDFKAYEETINNLIK